MGLPERKHYCFIIVLRARPLASSSTKQTKVFRVVGGDASVAGQVPRVFLPHDDTYLALCRVSVTGGKRSFVLDYIT